MRCISIKVLPMVLIMGLFSVGVATAEEKIDLAHIITEALKSNPGLAAARHNAEALAHRPAQEGSLPNPMLSLGLVNVPTDSFSFDEQAMTQKTIGLTQRFPWPGKLDLKKEIAEREAVSGSLALKSMELELTRDVKKAYFSLFFKNRAIEITERNKKLIKELIRIAEAKYSVGSGIQQDVLKAQVELSRMMEKLISLKEERYTLKGKLNSMMNRPPQASLGDPVEAELSSPELDVEKIQAKAEKEHPRLRSLDSIVEKNKKANLLARKEHKPDFDVSLQYGQREDGNMADRPDFVSANVKFALPLWREKREDKKVLETSARVGQAEREYELVRSRIFFDVARLVESARSHRERALLFKDGIIPQARASLDSAISGYQVNKVDFLTLLNNQITLFNYEIEYYKAVADNEIVLAELEEAAGGRLYTMNEEKGDSKDE